MVYAYFTHEDWLVTFAVMMSNYRQHSCIEFHNCDHVHGNWRLGNIPCCEARLLTSEEMLNI